ncbi:AAA family ATPase [Massilia sp. GCM10023247]|uniref:AAA family ATPase n=1 Tax=Massilia sp. GCM10023247 TaxID=3252643 RepID=UPI0036108887
MKITINNKHKSIPKGLIFELPSFCVLTGKNGSGKSHLLEAVANGSVAAVFICGEPAKVVHYVGYNGLNPQVDEQSDSAQIINTINGYWQQIQNFSQNYRQLMSQGNVYADIISQYLIPHYGPNPALYAAISRILKQSGKRFEDLTQDDVASNISFVDMTQSQLFFSQCALIFKAYHTRQLKNDFAKFRNSENPSLALPVLSKDEFITKYGPAPWELINDVLKRAGLPYQVQSPDVGDFELPYRLRLIDSVRGVDISVNDLSSGEKVLMSLALAIYNTSEGGSKPDLLLLDEPDAPLHPQFSKLLIDTLLETIVQKAGVNVLMTTHSPSTVAMAPEGTVYEIDRDTKMPREVSNSYAVEILTEGISFLKISFEKRRQVFVESRYDVQYFQRLYDILRRRHSFEYEPVFLEPHSGTSNCSDVIAIVEKLRASGSDLVFGVIDFDCSNRSTDAVFVLGDGARYAIENYLLDPLFVALTLIRYGRKGFNDFGVIGKGAYTDAGNLSQLECQTIIDNFVSLLGAPSDEILKVSLENGFAINYPKSILLLQGHEYEAKVRSAFVELNSISKGQGDSALKLGVLQVVGEFPQFLPVDVAETFKKVLGP